jgi:DNA-binding NarL/FixJ family response regulator
VISVTVADNNLLVREGLKALVDGQPGFNVVAACSDYEELMDSVARESPDVVITDIRMPPTNSDEGIRAAQSLRLTRPHVGVIVLSQYADAAYALALIENGSDRRGYLLKERIFDPAQLRAADQVHAGGSVIAPSVVDVLMRRQGAGSPLTLLSQREKEILAEIARGRTNAAIGAHLYISEKSVQGHINSIFAKLGLREDGATNRRVQAVLMYLDQA